VIVGFELRAAPWVPPPNIFCDFFFFFQDRVSQTICPGWFQITTLLISASWVARITGVSHCCPAAQEIPEKAQGRACRNFNAFIMIYSRYMPAYTSLSFSPEVTIWGHSCLIKYCIYNTVLDTLSRSFSVRVLQHGTSPKSFGSI
jgi:hypothetical protein